MSDYEVTLVNDNSKLGNPSVGNSKSPTAHDDLSFRG